MRNSCCVICQTEFEPREGKLYCSPACKQRGYTDKKQQIGAKEEKEKEQKVIQKQLELSFKEYQEYRDEYPKSMSSFIKYCFFRKNLHGNPTLKEIHDYIENFDHNFWEEFWEEGSAVRKRYKEFEAKYFGDEVVVSFSDKAIRE